MHTHLWHSQDVPIHPLSPVHPALPPWLHKECEQIREESHGFPPAGAVAVHLFPLPFSSSPFPGTGCKSHEQSWDTQGAAAGPGLELRNGISWPWGWGTRHTVHVLHFSFNKITLFYVLLLIKAPIGPRERLCTGQFLAPFGQGAEFGFSCRALQEGKGLLVSTQCLLCEFFFFFFNFLFKKGNFWMNFLQLSSALIEDALPLSQ